jgi:DNA polymerase III alpha subunit
MAAPESKLGREPIEPWYNPEDRTKSQSGAQTPPPDLGEFVHLHLHSNLSFKDSINTIEETAKWAAFRGQAALALTDHGHMFGAVRHAFACREAGIHPIFGMEAYESFVTDLTTGEQDDAYPAHLTLLVMNQTGWENICKIHTLSHTEPYAHRGKGKSRVYPRVDRGLLAAHSEGLICMSACLGGKVQRAFTDHKTDDRVILDSMRWYREVFGDRYYVELMGNTSDQRAILHHQRTLCKKAKVPVVATNDVHYLTQEQGQFGGVHHIYASARRGITPLKERLAEVEAAEDNDEGAYNATGWYGSDGFFLKSAQEMRETGFTESELRKSVEIAHRCIASGFSPLDLDFRVPEAPIEKADDLWLFEMWKRSNERVLV